MNKKKILPVLMAVSAITMLSAGGYGLYRVGLRQGAQQLPEINPVISTTKHAQTAERVDSAIGKRVLYWHDPMVPGQKFDKPGKSPFMDMELVPMYAEEGSAKEEGSKVSIDPQVQQNLGIRTAEVKRGTLAASTAGKVVPEWIALQEEYFVIRNMDRSMQGNLLDAVQQRMRLAGMSEEQIRGIESTGKTQQYLQMKALSVVKTGVLLIPSEAVIQTGKRSVVMLAQDNGKFIPVKIETGMEANGQTEVRRGLQTGQKVVVSGQFLLDSEASLKGVETRSQGVAQ